MWGLWIDCCAEFPTTTAEQPHSFIEPVPPSALTYKWIRGKGKVFLVFQVKFKIFDGTKVSPQMSFCMMHNNSWLTKTHTFVSAILLLGPYPTDKLPLIQIAVCQWLFVIVLVIMAKEGICHREECPLIGK